MSVKVKLIEKSIRNHPVFSNVSFDVEDGGVLLIDGDTKSRDILFNILSGTDKVSGGSITISGYDIDDMGGHEKQKFFRNTVSCLRGYFLQSNLTIKDNIALPSFFSGIGKRERETRIESIAKKFDIVDILKIKPTKISDDMRERVCLARTLLMNPKVILATEPSEWTTEVLLRYIEAKNAVLIISSNNPNLRKYTADIITISSKEKNENF